MTSEQEKLLLMLCDMHSTHNECRRTFQLMRQCEFSGVVSCEDFNVLMEVCPFALQYYRHSVNKSFGEIREQMKHHSLTFLDFMQGVWLMREEIVHDRKTYPTRLFPLTIPAA